MADDARTEARLRVAEAIDRAPACGHPTAGMFDTCSACLADAVLGLFLNVDWRGSLNGSTGIRARQLTLHGPVEPVTGEATDAR